MDKTVLPSPKVNFANGGEDINLRNLGPTQIKTLHESVAQSNKTSFDFSDNALTDSGAGTALSDVVVFCQ